MRKAEKTTTGFRAAVPLTVGLGLLAASILTIASGEDSGRVWVFAELVLQAVLAVSAAVWIGRKAKDWETPPSVSPVLVVLGFGTFVCEPFYRTFGVGRPGEIVLMDGLKHVVLGLAVVSYWRQYRRLAVLMSLFLMMFAVSISTDRAVQIAAGIFAAVALFWAAADYWEGLRDSLIAESKGGVPRWWLAGVAVAFVAVLATASAGSGGGLQNLTGFMPSSGGTDWYDPYARDGVRDGDAVVAGSKDIRSFAPIEDAPFMVDDRPTLYDVFDDSYEEPVKNKKYQRAISLVQEFAIDRCQQRLAQLKKAGKEFSTFRKPKDEKQKGRMSDRDGGAMFYVAGRTPLHLRLRAYDLFDGEVWVEEDEEVGVFNIRKVDGKPWAIPPLPPESFAVFAASEGHMLKIIDLDTAVIPAPLHTRGVHIDQVDRADFYKIAYNDMPALDRDAIPPLTTIHVASEVVDRDTLQDEWRLGSSAGPSYSAWPDHPDWQDITRLADEWTSSATSRWDMVQAVTARLREGYRFERGVGTPASRRTDGEPSDREAATGDASDDGQTAGRPETDRLPVSSFLFDTKAGDDYHFATAAAMLLRAKGFSTRLVQGFYASPDAYDPKAKNTPVRAEDVHTWCEVYLGTRVWLTVEATPGYEVLGPPPTLVEQAIAALAAGWRAVSDRPLTSLAITALAVFAWIFRADLLDFVDTVVWRARGFTDERSRLLATAGLLERRGQRIGLRRPAGTTLRRWLGATYGFTFDETSFLRSLDAASFAGHVDGPPVDVRALVARYSLAGLRKRHGRPRSGRLTFLRSAMFTRSDSVRT